jgi:hypothetical protein
MPGRLRAGRHQAKLDGAEQGSLRAVGRQLDADAGEVLDHACADLDKALADGGELSLCGGSVCGMASRAASISQYAAV